MSKYHIICSLLVNLLFVCAGSILAGDKNTEANIKLPDEIRNIIELNQANFESVKSIHGTIKTISTITYEGKGTRVIEEVEEIWSDSDHFRCDTLEAKFVGQETERLVVDEIDGHAVYLGTRSVGHTEIESIESRLFYMPVANSVTIVTSNWDSDARNINPFLHYQSYWGSTLKDIIIRRAERGSNFTIKSEMLESDECVLLESYISDTRSSFRIWVVPSKGYCIKRLQRLSNDQVRFEYTTTLKEYSPELWWFDSVKSKNIRTQRDGSRSETIREISVSSLELNEPIDPETFTLAGTNIPSGTRIRNLITGERYSYVKVPSFPNLIGKPLPELKDLGIDLSPTDMNQKSMLVCFFDYEQRPSRNCIIQLNTRAQELTAQDVEIVAIQASKIEQATLDKWLKEQNISFPTGMIEDNEEQVRFNWGVQSLPWLILTDAEHIVAAEGFSVNELDEKIKEAENEKK